MPCSSHEPANCDKDQSDDDCENNQRHRFVIHRTFLRQPIDVAIDHTPFGRVLSTKIAFEQRRAVNRAYSFDAKNDDRSDVGDGLPINIKSSANECIGRRELWD